MTTTQEGSGGSVEELHKKVEGLLRAAQSALFNGKKEQCSEELDKARSLLEQLEAAGAAQPKLALLRQKYDRQRQDFERRRGSGSSGPSRPAAPVGAPAGVAAKLPAGATKRLGEIGGELDHAEQALADSTKAPGLRIAQAGAALEAVARLQGEIATNYGDKVPPDHADLQAIASRIASVQERAQALAREAEQKARGDEQTRGERESRCGVWIQRLEPYRAGAPEPQLLFQHSSEPSVLASRQEALERSRALLAELRAQDWSGGVTPDLEQAQRDLVERLEQAESVYGESLKRLVAEPVRLVQEQLDFFQKDQGWLSDERQKPRWVAERDRNAIEESLTRLTPVVRALIGEEDSGLRELAALVERLWSEDRKRREALSGRVFMDADRYGGSDAQELRAQAALIVVGRNKEATVLRVSLPTPEWRVEDVVEHTDTSRTASRHRVTHWQFSQVAAKDQSGVHLYRVHLGKDQQADGSFGSLYGNAEDHPLPMAEANVRG